MKVVILHRNSFDMIGGAEGTIYNIAKTLKSIGIDPVIVAKQRTNAPVIETNDFCTIRRYNDFNVPRPLLFISPYYEYRNALKSVKQIIQDEMPDLIITRDPILAFAVSKFYDIKKIVYVPLLVIKYYNKNIRKSDSFRHFITNFVRWIALKQETHYQNQVFRTYNNIAVFSKNVEDQIIRAVGKKNNITINPPGVADYELYDKPYDYSVHDEFNIPHDKKLFLFVGRVVQEKNLRMLIEAFSKTDNDNTVLCIVGGGDDLEYIKAMTQRLDISHKVVFAGMRRDTERFYKAADFFVLPSYYESFGNVVPEAFIAGTPVIGFKTIKGKTLTAMDELVADDNLGILCDEFSAEALTHALNKAYELCTSANYINMRKYCRQHALQNYNWDKFVSTLLSMLRSE